MTMFSVQTIPKEARGFQVLVSCGQINVGRMHVKLNYAHFRNKNVVHNTLSLRQNNGKIKLVDKNKANA